MNLCFWNDQKIELKASEYRTPFGWPNLHYYSESNCVVARSGTPSVVIPSISTI